MTKSYKDGILDAIQIVSRWKGLGIQPSIVYTILDKLYGLLDTADFDLSQNKHYEQPKNITEI